MDPILMDREIHDLQTVGLAVIEYHARSWTCALNHHPDVRQNCRHDNWVLGVDGRVRPRPGFRVSASWYKDQPRIKIHTKTYGVEPPVQVSFPPNPGLPPLPPPSSGDSIAMLARIEAKLDRLLSLSHGVVQSAG